MLPAAQAYGLGIIPWSPLHGGLLGGVLRTEREGSRRVAPRQQPVIDEHREQLVGAQRTLELRLEDKVLDRLDENFPGYKAAPEHYAW